MANLVKCPQCGEMNTKEYSENYKNRYYCPTCLLEKKEVERVKEEKEEAKKAKRLEKSTDWDVLFNYICEIYGENPTGRMYKQLGDYRKPPYKYTDMGMYLTLRYFYETKKNPVIKNTGVGIIPYVYEEAKRNFIKQREINKANSGIGYNNTKKYIKVNITKNIISNKKVINFDSLEGDLL